MVVSLFRCVGLLLALATLSPAALAQAPQNAPPGQPAAEHPLAPTIRWAHGARQSLEGVNDYSCTFIKRERIGDELAEHQYMFLKVRHRPFSVYIYFLAPDDVKGQEAIYVEGRNNGNLLAHATGLKDTLVGTLSLKPDSAMAMKGNRHPITDIGLLNLTQKITATGERAMQYNEGNVQYIQGVKINGRIATCMQFVYPVQRKEYAHHMTRLFVDDELRIPIRYEGYGWPTKAGEEPPLIEEYTYLNLKFNNNFTDEDFDHRNPNYKFK